MIFFLACSVGKYGDNCEQDCQCENGAACDHISGACTCGPGWIGTYCERPCPRGFHGIECKNTCDCGHGISCHPETGLCHCPPGKHGDKCLKSKNCSLIFAMIYYFMQKHIWIIIRLLVNN